MKTIPSRIELSRTAITTFIVKKLMEEPKISAEEALNNFMATHTYTLLRSKNSKLWLESPEYVYDMLQSELNNDIERWLKI